MNSFTPISLHSLNSLGELESPKEMNIDKKEIRSQKKEKNKKIEIKMNEKELLIELLYILQGIETESIKRNSEGQFVFVLKEPKIDRKQREICDRMFKMGNIVHQILEYSNLVDQEEGMIEEGAKRGIKHLMQEYLKLITVLDNEMQGESSISLMRLFCIMREPSRKLQLIFSIISEIKEKKSSSSILQILSNFCVHSDEMMRKQVCQVILKYSSNPIFIILNNWLTNGTFHDPKNEFFISVSENFNNHNRSETEIDSSFIWNSKYRLNQSLLIDHFYSNYSSSIFSILSHQMANNLLTIGKSLNFYNLCCSKNDSSSFQQKNTTKLEMKMEISLLQSTIQKRKDQISTIVLESVKNDHKFLLKCYLIKQYFLMCDAAFSEKMLDEFCQEKTLFAPRESLSSSQLSSSLQNVLNQLASFYRKDDALFKLAQANLYLKLLNPNDQLFHFASQEQQERKSEEKKEINGWRIFSLSLFVDSPIDVILTKQVILSYSNLFNFLFRLKSTERFLVAGWKTIKSQSNSQFSPKDPTQKKELIYIGIIYSDMINFIKSILNYFYFNCIEQQWSHFVHLIHNKRIQTLDHLISAHSIFLENIQSSISLFDSQLFSTLQTILALSNSFSFSTNSNNSLSISKLYSHHKNLFIQKIKKLSNFHQHLKSLITSLDFNH